MNPIVKLKTTSLDGDTDEIKLIPFSGKEAETIKRWFESDNQIRTFYYTSPNITDYQEWIDEILISTKMTYLRIENKGHFVGFIKISNYLPKMNSVNVGIVLRKASRGIGIATEALRLLIHNISVKKIISKKTKENRPAVRLLKRLGFTHSNLTADGKDLYELEI